MPLENNPMEGHTDIAQFLEKFKEQPDYSASAAEFYEHPKSIRPLSSQAEHNLTFEKLEDKMRELEEKFSASARQNDAILRELAKTREAMESQKNRDEFFSNITVTINSLKQSVEALSKAQAAAPAAYSAPVVQRSFDRERPAAATPEKTDIYHYQPDAYRQAQEEKARQEREDKERIISSLKQKASQLKAVNFALDREIKKVQVEKMEALKKSAEQAKEILSLRDQLTAAEERFKSFNFEGRIISIRQEYQQKVTSLENQLHAISDTCMKQVEEIESLKAENLKLHKIAEETEELRGQFERKNKEVETLRVAIQNVRLETTKKARERLAVFMERMRLLEGEREGLSSRLASAQQSLEQVMQEKQTLESNFKALLEKIKANDSVIETLKQKINVLTSEKTALSQENQTLSRQKQELTGERVRLNQAKEFFTRQNTDLGREKTELSQAREELLKQNQELKNQNTFLLAQKTEQDKAALRQRQEVMLSKETEPESVDRSAVVRPMRKTQPAAVPASEMPVEMIDTMRSKLQTSADLPEIKVAEPAPQEDLFNGEDFLEKTDSFIGRMKWSIFREDK